MSAEHNYHLDARMIKPMFVGVTLDGMKEFEVTSAPDWWPDAPPGKFSPQTLLLSASASCIILSLFKAAHAFHAEWSSKMSRSSQMGHWLKMDRYGDSTELI
jgi:uncharacterized OsmC-like protein